MPSSDQQPDEPLVTLPQVVFLHTVAIVEFGGASGVRDRGLLESALARPLSGFGAQRLFTTPWARTAALMHALIQNHGFIDGNKRTAVLAAAFWLAREGYELTAAHDDVVATTLSVAEHRCSPAQLAGWIERNSRPFSGNGP